MTDQEAFLKKKMQFVSKKPQIQTKTSQIPKNLEFQESITVS